MQTENVFLCCDNLNNFQCLIYKDSIFVKHLLYYVAIILIHITIIELSYSSKKQRHLCIFIYLGLSIS